MREIEDAAERVMRAMRALDAHRHAPAATLEREYRKALEAYFVASQRAVADGDEREDERDEGIARADEVRRVRSAIDAHYIAARQALRLARAYRREAGTTGRRERECFEAVQRHRDAIRAQRMKLRPEAEQLSLPGLAKTRPSAPPMRIGKTG